MKKVSFLIVALLAFFIEMNAQQIPVIEDRETAIIKPLRLSGPRVGVTYAPSLTSSNYGDSFGDSSFTFNSPFISQFGWQFEWKYFETMGGSAGLFEIIPLIGGLEQGIIVPSMNLLVGYRDAGGFELGAGPNLNLISPGFVVAVGYTIQSKHMNFPINFAVTPNRDGTRFSLLFGFTKRSGG